MTTIAGLQVYQSSPQTGGASELRGNILYLPDGFGLATHNLQLADLYAQNGMLHYLDSKSDTVITRWHREARGFHVD
jgi:hypothetical protein